MAKKKTIVAIEDIQPDTLRSESGKFLNNFICYEEHLAESFEKASRRDIFNTNKVKSTEDINNAIKNWNNPKKLLFYNTDDIAAYEVKLSPKVKSTDEYVYRVRYTDYNNTASEVYGTFKEIFPLVSRKVKNKYAMVLFNGNAEKIEYTEELLGKIVEDMTPDTNAVIIYQISRDGEEGEGVLITAYKNFLRK